MPVCDREEAKWERRGRGMCVRQTDRGAKWGVKERNRKNDYSFFSGRVKERCDFPHTIENLSCNPKYNF